MPVMKSRAARETNGHPMRPMVARKAPGYPRTSQPPPLTATRAAGIAAQRTRAGSDRFEVTRAVPGPRGLGVDDLSQWRPGRGVDAGGNQVDGRLSRR